jgi:hypothetical protein
MMSNRAISPMLSSDKMDWSTPQALYDELDREFGFTVDVCDELDREFGFTVDVCDELDREFGFTVEKGVQE